ncbi:MAG: hypothetical protein JWP35_2470 [Caulobacter sp.]|nr:hypothetical protein [Caulobacter sp.]
MTRFALISAALIAATALPLAARADVRAPVLALQPPRIERIQDRLIPLPQVIAQLRGRGGEYVSANVSDQGGRTVYLIRMRHAGGRFVDYVVDAHTGQILSQQGG